MVGIQLITEVLEYAPGELTSRERLLLVVIAEDARDSTRTGWPGMDKLTRRTGLSASSVRDILAQLARRGYELRVPAGTDTNGKPVYAHHGRNTAYRLPDFRERRQDPGTFKAPDSRHLDETKAPDSRHERRQVSGTKAPDSRRPSPHISSDIPSCARDDDHPENGNPETQAVIAALHRRTGQAIDPGRAAGVVRQLVGERGSGSARPGVGSRVAYLAGAIAKDPDPSRFLPMPSPPPFHPEDYR